MYNIHSHYETIFHALKSIVTHRRVFYLMPYGSTQPENVESITDNLDELNTVFQSGGKPGIDEGPLLLFYDQEPIVGDYNHPLFNSIEQHYGHKILITTEKDSKPLNDILEKYKWKSVYYFHHAFAAHDWYRGYRYDARLLPPENRNIKKKFISFNRITSGLRAYRSLLISELANRDILSEGYVSFNDNCSEGGDYKENLLHLVEQNLMSKSDADHAISTIDKLDLPLRIDYKDSKFIPNHSFVLSAIEETQESFCYLVTETCYWEQKKHLTEKIFKPIVSRMPFVLVGPAHNLKYLREYGFKTFSPWIDETYDDIENPVERMHAIGETMTKICRYSETDLQEILKEMSPVLKHNFDRFYSNEFIDSCWDELFSNMNAAINGS